MPKTSKKFIDKKNSVTFKLVHRSQRDPLVADEKAPQRVLVPIEKQVKKESFDLSKLSKQEREKYKEEQHKYGIFYDDDYDYLQHLRDVQRTTTEWEQVENTNIKKEKETQKINLPSSVFESNVEEKEGLLNKAAPVGLTLYDDPDIMDVYAAMDDDFNFSDPDNELENDFIAMANAPGSDIETCTDEEEEEDDEFNVSSGEEMDEVHSLGKSAYSVNRKNRTSNCGSTFSLTSSVIRRNEHLKLLDEKHERVMSEFDDTEIGALDFHEIEGYMEPNSNLLLQYAEDFKKEESVSIADLMREKMKLSELHYNSEEEDADLVEMIVPAREDNCWDCESILSINNNTKNHPGLISEKRNKIHKIEIDRRTGIPKNVLGNDATKLTAKNIEHLQLEYHEEHSGEDDVSIAQSRKSRLSVLSYRNPNETPEEKKMRKKSLKEYRKERREEKKANTLCFKEEKKRQEKIMLNKRVNIQGHNIL